MRVHRTARTSPPMTRDVLPIKMKDSEIVNSL